MEDRGTGSGQGITTLSKVRKGYKSPRKTTLSHMGADIRYAANINSELLYIEE